jgi:hypothetical protein
MYTFIQLKKEIKVNTVSKLDRTPIKGLLEAWNTGGTKNVAVAIALGLAASSAGALGVRLSNHALRL